MYRKILLVVALVIICVLNSKSYSDEVEVITVTGQRVNIINALAAIAWNSQVISRYGDALRSQDRSTFTELIEELCAELGANQPNSCDGDTRPQAIDYEPDGCSAPEWAGAAFWNQKFDSPCNNHDICYNSIDGAKLRCDDEFGQDLSQVCQNLPTDGPRQRGFQTRCYEQVSVYYRGVRNFGHRYFNDAQGVTDCDAFFAINEALCES